MATSTTIMFVCHGNICRSPLAGDLFNQLAHQRSVTDRCSADSSGVIGFHSGERADSRMRQTAARHGLDLSHIAQQMKPAHFLQFDLFLAMDRSNWNALRRIAPEEDAMAKIHMFREWDPEGQGDVPDPYYGGMSDFEAVFNIVHRTCSALLAQLA